MSGVIGQIFRVRLKKHPRKQRLRSVEICSRPQRFRFGAAASNPSAILQLRFSAARSLRGGVLCQGRGRVFFDNREKCRKARQQNEEIEFLPQHAGKPRHLLLAALDFQIFVQVISEIGRCARRNAALQPRPDMSSANSRERGDSSVPLPTSHFLAVLSRVIWSYQIAVISLRPVTQIRRRESRNRTNLAPAHSHVHVNDEQSDRDQRC